MNRWREGLAARIEQRLNRPGEDLMPYDVLLVCALIVGVGATIVWGDIKAAWLAGREAAGWRRGR